MADGKIITHEQLAEEGIIKDYLQKEFEELVEYLPVVEKSIKSLAVNLGTSLKGIKVGDLDLKGLTDLESKMKEINQLADINNKTQKLKVELTNQQIAQNQVDKSVKKDLIEGLKAEIILQNQSVGTLQKVEAASAKLRIERKALNTETEAGRTRLVAINAELDKNNKYVKDNSDALKQQKLNVGNYTASIKEAFQGTGILGDTINKYLGIITALSTKLEMLTGLIIGKSAAEKEEAAATEAATGANEANTVSTETNTSAKETETVVEEANIVAKVENEEATTALVLATDKEAIATEEARVAGEANVIVLDAETVSTEAATVATKGLVAALATNPFVLAAIAIAALAKVAYDNMTATQAQRDAFDASKAGLEAWAQAADIAGMDAGKLREEVKQLYLVEKQNEDLSIQHLVTKQKLRTEAALAREQATIENTTTAEKIKYLQVFIDKTKQAGEMEVHGTERVAKQKQAIVDAYGKMATREQVRAAEEAKAAVSAAEEDIASSVRRAEKQQTTLKEKYYEDTTKMLQDAQKSEIDSIDTFSNLKTQQLNLQLNKDIKLNDIETAQKVENLKHQQAILGAVDAEGVDHTKEFEREINAIKEEGASKNKQLEEKASLDLYNINLEYQQKVVDSDIKFRDTIDKLNETAKASDKKTQDDKANDIQSLNEFEVSNNQTSIDEIKKQNETDRQLKKTLKYTTLADLQSYYNNISRLQDEHYATEQAKIKADADFAKKQEDKKSDDAIQAIQEKYAKEKIEEDKAIKSKASSPEEAAGDINDNDALLAQRQAKEIEGVKQDNGAALDTINADTNSKLLKSDIDYQKNKKALTKQEQEQADDDLAHAKEISDKKIDQAVQEMQSVLNAVSEGLQQRSTMLQAADQNDIDQHTRLMNVQAQLAAGGRANSLASEQAEAEQAEEKKIQDAKKAQKEQEAIQLANIVLELTAAYAKSGNTNNPEFKALAVALAAKGMAAAIGGYYEGTESLSADGAIKIGTGRDNLLIRAHEGERILGVEDSKAIKGLSNEEVKNAALMYMNDDFNNIYIPNYNASNIGSANIAVSSHDTKLAEIFTTKIDDLKRTIESQPKQSVKLDRIGEWTETVMRNNNKIITHHLRRSGRAKL